MNMDNLSKGFVVPKFTRHCEKCVFLGISSDGLADLYIRFQTDERLQIETIIARTGDEPYEYYSGFIFGFKPESKIHYLREALILALEKDEFAEIILKQIANQPRYIKYLRRVVLKGLQSQ